MSPVQRARSIRARPLNNRVAITEVPVRYQVQEVDATLQAPLTTLQKSFELPGTQWQPPAQVQQSPFLGKNRTLLVRAKLIASRACAVLMASPSTSLVSYIPL